MSTLAQASSLPPGVGFNTGKASFVSLAATEAACIPNISKAERRKRLTFGIIGLVFSLGVLAVLIATGADRAWRVVMLPLFWGATTGFFQWWDKT